MEEKKEMIEKKGSKDIQQTVPPEHWEEVRNAMAAFGYFDELDEEVCREGCVAAKMKTYKTNDTLLGDGSGFQAYVYFLLSGKCQLIETLQIATVRHLDRNIYTLYDSYVPTEESDEDLDRKYFGTSSDGLEPTQTGELNVKTEIKDNGNPIKTRGDVTTTGDYSGSCSTKPFEIPTGILRTYFMQVCIFNPGSTFGIGENMRDRRIVALTTVECMLLPKVWLMQHNIINIWTRIENYLGKKIPSKKELFKEFVSARRWQEYRERVVEEVASRGNSFNWTSIHDVPYSIRLEDMISYK
ncbi:hypothetical protein EVAR_2506_1 [Eumeta japonica]|uniref:Cyclic nucleotide-binding domain-containing protein n=1 Tax=Eumeta variegata TaxID=151549 RepID=A0A4C1SPF3_EUMVA|nr:hypothetical protein EVAR_2506_1 [Eumeta japonica]